LEEENIRALNKSKKQDCIADKNDFFRVFKREIRAAKYQEKTDVVTNTT